MTRVTWIFFVNLSTYLWQFLNAVSYIGHCFMHGQFSSEYRTHPCVWGILSCAVDILLGRKFRQASLELVSYTYDTFLFERRKLQNIVCCCVRDTIALFKRLLRFWATFWNDTILARSKSASLLLWFIRICQKLCCSYRYYYTCINMYKKTQTTDVLAAGSVFTSSKCCCTSKRY